MVARVIRVFEAETPGGATQQRLARALEFISVPTRGDRAIVPDRSDDDAIPVERTVFLASLPDATWAPGVKSVRVVIHLAAEPAEHLDAARAAGWRTL